MFREDSGRLQRGSRGFRADSGRIHKGCGEDSERIQRIRRTQRGLGEDSERNRRIPRGFRDSESFKLGPGGVKTDSHKHGNSMGGDTSTLVRNGYMGHTGFG